MRLEDMTLSELLDVEEAATIVRKNYENESALSRDVNTGPKDDALLKKLYYYNAIRLKTIKEIERRIHELE